MAASQAWAQTISADRPFTFTAESGNVLHLRSCSLKPGGAAASLTCTPAGGSTLTLARATASTPTCNVRAMLVSETTLSVSGPGQLFVSALLLPGANKKRRRSADAVAAATLVAAVATKTSSASTPAKVEERPAKVAKVEAQPKAEPKKVPAVTPVPKAVAKAPAVAKPADVKSPAPAAAKPNVAEPNKTAPPAAAAASAAANGKATEESKVNDANGEAKKAKEAKPKQPVSRKVTSSGLQYEVLKAGSGRVAISGKNVQVRYEGYLTNGHRFDKGNIRFRLGLGEVIQGWDEGIKGMFEGEQRRLLVPPRLAYGAAGSPPTIPPNSNLIFEVTLVSC